MESSNKKLKKQLRKEIAGLQRNTSVRTNGLDFVTVEGEDKNFELIGCGCSSAVFRSKSQPWIAVKVYSPEHVKEVLLEVMAYKKVKGVPCFPRLYLYGINYLAIEYIEGISLYDCLIQGIEIPEHIITQVDDAIAIAKARKLVPSDVHFKNIILHGDRVTLIDLSDYMSAKHISRWDRLKFFYKTVYRHFLRGYKVPKRLLDFSRKTYKLLERLLKPFTG